MSDYDNTAFTCIADHAKSLTVCQEKRGFWILTAPTETEPNRLCWVAFRAPDEVAPLPLPAALWAPFANPPAVLARFVFHAVRWRREDVTTPPTG